MTNYYYVPWYTKYSKQLRELALTMIIGAMLGNTLSIAGIHFYNWQFIAICLIIVIYTLGRDSIRRNDG